MIHLFFNAEGVREIHIHVNHARHGVISGICIKGKCHFLPFFLFQPQKFQRCLVDQNLVCGFERISFFNLKKTVSVMILRNIPRFYPAL